MKRPHCALIALLTVTLSLAAQGAADKGGLGQAGGVKVQQSGGSGAAPAGQGAWRREVKELDLKPAELKGITALISRNVDSLATAASEMKIVQARLERLLLEKEPDLEAIRQLVKSGLEWELKARMVRIEWAIELRKLLGPDRWARMQKLQREYLQAKRSGKLKVGDLGENAEALIEILDRLE
jgi:hypothetical protein